MLAVLILIAFLFIAEVTAMLALDKLFITSEFFWLETFFDACLMALATTLIIHIMYRFKLIRLHHLRSIDALQFQAGILAFGVTAGLMLLYSLFNLERTLEIFLVDAALFSLMTTAGLYLFLLRDQTDEKPPNPDTVITSTIIKHVASYLFGVLLLALLLINVYNQQFKKHVQQVIDRETLQLSITEETLRGLLANAVLDAIVMSQQHDKKTYLSGDQDIYQKLTIDYLNLAKVKQSYEQIRLIDSTGMERIRVNRTHDGQPILVQKEALQNKKNRYYFTQTMQLTPSEFYISPLDLNIEHGEIEQPLKPIVRVASPITIDQHNRGIIIINLSAQKMLAYLDKQEKAINGHLILLNSNNYWLHGGGESQWAFMFPDRKEQLFSNTYPEISQYFQNRDSGYIESDHGFFVFTSVYTGSDLNPFVSISSNSKNWPTWKLISFISQEEMSEKLTNFRHLIYPFFILIVIVTAAGASMYSLSRIKHLKSEFQIQHMAEHDTLTGLKNRRLFVMMLDKKITQLEHTEEPIALMYLDLDYFKPINDQYGHEMGDRVLIETAQRMQKCLRKPDILARLGGDEFAILLPDIERIENANQIAERILKEMQKPFVWNEHSVSIGISIGIVYSQSNSHNRHQLLNFADQAMYSSKNEGPNGYKVFEV